MSKYHKCHYYIVEVLQKINDNNKASKVLFLGAIKLTGRHHLDQLVLLIKGRLLLDHLLFTCVCGGGVIYRKIELTKDHSSTSGGG
jgi:hypothetical protein